MRDPIPFPSAPAVAPDTKPGRTQPRPPTATLAPPGTPAAEPVATPAAASTSAAVTPDAVLPAPAKQAAPADVAATRKEDLSAPYNHHMRVRKAAYIAEGVERREAHRRALADWRENRREPLPGPLRRDSVVVVDGGKPRAKPTSERVRPSQEFRARLGEVGTVLARFVRLQAAPIHIAFYPADEDGDEYVRVRAGAANEPHVIASGKPAELGELVAQAVRNYKTEVIEPDPEADL